MTHTVLQSSGLFSVLPRCANTERPFDDEGFDVLISYFLDKDDELDKEDGVLLAVLPLHSSNYSSSSSSVLLAASIATKVGLASSPQ